MMMAMMQMIFQQILGLGGGGVPLTTPNFGGERAQGPSMESFLGASPSTAGGKGPRPAGPSRTGPARKTRRPKPEAAGTKLNTAGTEFGKKFAAQAEKTARRINTPGLCLKGVNDTMQAMGLPVKREAAAYMALDDFRNNKRFQEVKVSKEQLKSLPAGAVVIWDKGSGLPYGHISVSLGKGREASSTVRDQLLLNTKFHVFIPKAG